MAQELEGGAVSRLRCNSQTDCVLIYNRERWGYRKMFRTGINENH